MKLIIIPILLLVSGCLVTYEGSINESNINSTLKNTTSYLYNDTSTIYFNATYITDNLAVIGEMPKCCYQSDCPQAINNPDECYCMYVTEYVEGEVDCLIASK